MTETAQRLIGGGIEEDKGSQRRGPDPAEEEEKRRLAHVVVSKNVQKMYWKKKQSFNGQKLMHSCKTHQQPRKKSFSGGGNIQGLKSLCC